MSDDSRANRLRSRRGRARQRAEQRQQDDAVEPDARSERADSSAGTEPAKEETDAGGTEPDDAAAAGASEDETGSVKDERVGTYMYLPESQKRELERVYGTLKVQYEYEYDEEFEKNRHFFPAVVRYGLDALDGMDAAEVRDVVTDE